MYRYITSLIIALMFLSFSVSCTQTGSAGTWQETAERGHQEFTNKQYQKSAQLLLSALKQLSESKVAVKEDDPTLEKLMLYYIPEVLRSHRAIDSVQDLLNEKLAVCQKLFGDKSIPAADALYDIQLYGGRHDIQVQRENMGKFRNVCQSLQQANTPYFGSEWKKKKDAFLEEQTGERRILPSYSIASQDIPKAGMLTKQNIKEVFADYPHPARAIGGCSVMFGCRTLQPIAKESPITTTALCKDPGPLVWDHILPTDPKWVKYAKTAVTSEQKKQYAEAIQADESCLTELKKMADAGKKMEDFCDRAYLSSLYSHDLTYENLHPNEVTAPNPLSDDYLKRSKRDLEVYKAELDWHTRAYAILSKLMPADCSNVVSEKKAMEQLPERIKKTQEWEAFMKQKHAELNSRLERLNPISGKK